jgi:EmrB/QacA subfamily drug resistance transporter
MVTPSVALRRIFCVDGTIPRVSNPKAFPCADAALHRSTPAVPACADRKTWVLTAAVLASTMAYIDESVVNVALPRMESDLHASLGAMQWVVNGYTLSMTALLLTGGAAADQFGRRLVFLIGIGVFAVASIGCGVATTVPTLLLARGVQGVGAALLIPCSLALIGAAYEPNERGAAIGIWSGASAIASGAAPLIGGWLVDHSTWRAIFLINPVLAVPAAWIGLYWVPESSNPAAQRGIDRRGAMLALAGLGCLIYGLIASSDQGWSRAAVLVPIAAGLVFLAAFVWSEQGSPAPMMPLELFHSRRFSGVNVLTLLLYGALGGAFFFLPFLLMQGRGYSATATGAVYLPFTVVVGLLSRWFGGLTDRFGARRPLIAGPVISGAGFAMLAAGSSSWMVVGAMILLGFGVAVTVAPLTATVMDAVPDARMGIASGINNAVASAGALLTIALLGSVCLGVFDRSLDRRLAETQTSQAVANAVQTARDGFVVPPLPGDLSAADRNFARQLIAASLSDTVRMALWIAALLALAGGLSAALTIRDKNAATTG